MSETGGLPFDVDGFESQIERWQAIADEVEAYLAARDGNPIPGKENIGLPGPLYWLEYVERWGLPYGKGWAEQPYYFMQELDWADIGRRRHDAAVAASLRLKMEAAQNESARTSLPIG